MKIKRVRTSFRSGVVTGVRGLHEGDLVPDNHPLVKKLPEMFEDVETYVARRHPDLVEQPERKRRGRPKAKPKTDTPEVEETTAPPEAQEEKVPDGEE